MKRLANILSIIVMLGAISGCTGMPNSGTSSSGSSQQTQREEDVLLDEIPKPPDFYKPFYVSATSECLTEDCGGYVDATLFNDSSTDTMEWLRRVEDMNLQSIRTAVYLEWYKAEEKGFDSTQMQCLYRLLDLCQQNALRMELSFNTYDKVSEYGEFANSVCEALTYLLEDKGYNCIQKFSICSNPSECFLDENDSYNADAYIDCCKAVTTQMEREGFAEKLTFVTLNGLDDIEKYKTSIEELSSISQLSNSLVSNFNKESTNTQMFDYATSYVFASKALDMKWGVSNFGTSIKSGQVEMDAYDRAILLARMAVNFTNAGAVNLCYGLVNDTSESTQSLGLWKGLNGTVTPQYYVWSLITKYTEKQSDIYPVTSSLTSQDVKEDVCITAYRLPGGAWTYLLVNSGTQSQNVSIISLHSTAQELMNIYTVSSATLPTNGKMITSSGMVQMKYCVLNITLSANSFTVLSNK